MSTVVRQPVAAICLFTWIGFVCAISFMEAWLKFQAPGVTLPIGLGIGRLVFGALNKVEWVFAVVICSSAVMNLRSRLQRFNISLIIVVLILLLQTVWLLPALDARAEMHIEGLKVPPSGLHFWFVGAEVVKVVALFFGGLSLFRQARIAQEV